VRLLSLHLVTGRDRTTKRVGQRREKPVTIPAGEARCVSAMSLVELRSALPALAASTRHRAANRPAAAEPSSAGDATPWRTLGLVAVLAGCVLAVAGTAIVNGDSVWHLIWGRELADGALSTFRTGPTPHPLLVALAALTSIPGDDASYMLTYIAFGPIAFAVLVAGVFEIARRLSSPFAAIVATLILGTSGVVSVASSARYDIAFAALVMAAVALEMARPRRGLAPLALLAAAGLIRPEAWVLAGAYWLWVAPPLSWAARLRLAAVVAVAPALWMAMDGLVMGDPLWSLHATDSGSDLYRQYSPWDNLDVARRELVASIGFVCLLLTVPGGLLLARDRTRPALPLVCTLGITLGLFALLLAGGMASNNRYLLVPICVFAVLAAVAVDGAGKRTRRRLAFGVPVAVLVALQLVVQSDVYSGVASRSASVSGWYDSAQSLVAEPGVREALRHCPDVSLPSGMMRHWFAFYSGRPPERFVSDGAGETRPDLYIAPASPAMAKEALTRARFDDDASFRVPPGLQRGPGNADWALYVSPASACARNLL
jgi:hypothetical protein